MEDVLRRNELGAVPSEVFLRIHNNNNNNLNSSMVLLCTVSCGRLIQSRGALTVKKFFRISRFALRTTTLHALPLESLSFRSNSPAVAFLS